MDLLKDLRMSLLNFDFVVIYIIHKILLLLKNHLNYLEDSIFESVFKEYNILFYIFSNYFFFATYNDRMKNSINNSKQLYFFRRQ